MNNEKTKKSSETTVTSSEVAVELSELTVADLERAIGGYAASLDGAFEATSEGAGTLQ